jgi:hypothetical protein
MLAGNPTSWTHTGLPMVHLAPDGLHSIILKSFQECRLPCALDLVSRGSTNTALASSTPTCKHMLGYLANYVNTNVS